MLTAAIVRERGGVNGAAAKQTTKALYSGILPGKGRDIYTYNNIIVS